MSEKVVEEVETEVAAAPRPIPKKSVSACLLALGMVAMGMGGSPGAWGLERNVDLKSGGGGGWGKKKREKKRDQKRSVSRKALLKKKKGKG